MFITLKYRLAIKIKYLLLISFQIFQNTVTKIIKIAVFFTKICRITMLNTLLVTLNGNYQGGYDEGY